MRASKHNCRSYKIAASFSATFLTDLARLNLTFKLPLLVAIILLWLPNACRLHDLNAATRLRRWAQAPGSPVQPAPDFLAPIGNLTVALGRDAQLSCKTQNLGNYKTAWLRVEDRGILSIHENIITRNYRVGLRNDDGNFVLTIKNVQASDKVSCSYEMSAMSPERSLETR